MNRSGIYMVAVMVVLAGLVPAVFIWERAGQPVGLRVDGALSSVALYDSVKVIGVSELEDITAVTPVNPLRLRVRGERVLISRNVSAIQFRAFRVVLNGMRASRRLRMQYTSNGKAVTQELSMDDRSEAPIAPLDSIAVTLAGGPVMYVPRDAADLTVDVLDGDNSTRVEITPTMPGDAMVLWRYGPSAGALRGKYLGSVETALACMQNAHAMPRDEVEACVAGAARRLAAITDEQFLRRYLSANRADIFSESNVNKMAETALLTIGKAAAEQPTACIHFHINGQSIYSMRFGGGRARWLVFGGDGGLLWEGEVRSARAEGFLGDPELSIAGCFNKPRTEGR